MNLELDDLVQKKTKASNTSVLIGCRSKKRYKTDIHAHEIIYKMKKKKIELHSYYCTFCGGWHLTKNKKVPKVLTHKGF